MIDAHKVVDYLMEHFNQDDMHIVLLLSQGTLAMKKCYEKFMKNGGANIFSFDNDQLQNIEKIDDYLSDVIEEELHDRL